MFISKETNKLSNKLKQQLDWVSRNAKERECKYLNLNLKKSSLRDKSNLKRLWVCALILEIFINLVDK